MILSACENHNNMAFNAMAWDWRIIQYRNCEDCLIIEDED